ncbi:ribonuclease III [[Eubacterium] cellulosolvens]
MEETRKKMILELLDHRIFQIPEPSMDNIELYDQALTHSSFTGELQENKHSVENNERLEFLGNFVLDLVISEYLYQEFNFTEGEMTRRMEVLSDAKLAEIIRKQRLRLEKGYLRLGKRSSHNKTELEDSIIAGWFEAFIGAIYLDQGLTKAREVILGLLAKEIKNFNPNRNYIGRLQEFVQQNKVGELTYIDKKVTGPDHRPTFSALVKIDNKKYGDGIGRSKKAARMRAAKMALKKLQNLKIIPRTGPITNTKLIAK